MANQEHATPEPERAWDSITDPDNPVPRVWPQCDTCDTPWVWRRALSLSKGYMWVWSPDCKHKTNPSLFTADGPYEHAERGT